MEADVGAQEKKEDKDADGIEKARRWEHAFDAAADDDDDAAAGWEERAARILFYESDRIAETRRVFETLSECAAEGSAIAARFTAEWEARAHGACAPDARAPDREAVARVVDQVRVEVSDSIERLAAMSASASVDAPELAASLRTSAEPLVRALSEERLGPRDVYRLLVLLGVHALAADVLADLHRLDSEGDDCCRGGLFESYARSVCGKLRAVAEGVTLGNTRQPVWRFHARAIVFESRFVRVSLDDHVTQRAEWDALRATRQDESRRERRSLLLHATVSSAFVGGVRGGLFSPAGAVIGALVGGLGALAGLGSLFYFKPVS